VHTDPVSIIAKILEQNPKTYTQLHDLLTLGTRMVEAGLTHHAKTPPTPEDETTHRLTAERRITAMCINAALAEDDFETAYSYVVNRLASSPPPPNPTSTDDYSWKAALQAGKYRRTAHTLPPPQTHRGVGAGSSGGLASGNADVRHLEQRIECLATALRVAPAATLQEIVNAFRRAEEELEVLTREEEEEEAEWDRRGDRLGMPVMPGAFTSSSVAAAPRGRRPAGGHGQVHGGGGGMGAAATARRQSKAEEDAAPMSLFDLSRASVLSAQRNLSALSGLQRPAGFGRLAGGGGGGRPAAPAGARAAGGAGGGGGMGRESSDFGGRSSMDMAPLSATGSTASAGSGADAEDRRVRKRDQLREAAMGTLVSGVGWLVGAPASGGGQQRE
jgi:hypothetical protein